MFQTSSLTDAQKSLVASWVQAGADLAEIQKKANEELKLGITYMETRFLILDLGLEIQNGAEPVKAEASAPSQDSANAEDQDPAKDGVTIELDEQPIAGMIVSGLVTFSDGEKGFFYVDEEGRPGLRADTENYEPSMEDIEDFKVKLQNTIIDQQERQTYGEKNI